MFSGSSIRTAARRDPSISAGRELLSLPLIVVPSFLGLEALEALVATVEGKRRWRVFLPLIGEPGAWGKEDIEAQHALIQETDTKRRHLLPYLPDPDRPTFKP